MLHFITLNYIILHCIRLHFSLAVQISRFLQTKLNVTRLSKYPRIAGQNCMTYVSVREWESIPLVF